MPEPSGVLVIHCSDARYQTHFQDFLRHDLKLESYALLAVPGGPQFLTLSEYLPKFSWAGWRWVKFLMNSADAHRVILIAHDDCRWYHEMGFAVAAPSAHDKQVADMRHTCAGIRERFPNIMVEFYYARLEKGGAVFQPA